jgi:hypothetical protein
VHPWLYALYKIVVPPLTVTDTLHGLEAVLVVQALTLHVVQNCVLPFLYLTCGCSAARIEVAEVETIALAIANSTARDLSNTIFTFIIMKFRLVISYFGLVIFLFFANS